jgi:hypothetical protein
LDTSAAERHESVYNPMARRRRGAMWRFRSVLWVMVLLLELRGVELRADEPFRRTLSNEVIGTEWAAPGDTVGFRVTSGGGVPGTLVTIYEQLGSNLSFVGSPPTTNPHFDRYCVISALPVKDLPGADPGRRHRTGSLAP